MFKLDNQRATLTKVTTFAENHGQEIKHGQALQMKMTLANTVLDQFEKGLTAALFERYDEKCDLAEQGQPELLPDLRFPDLLPIQYGYEGQGYRVIFHTGLSDKENIYLINTKLDSFKFDLKQGGSVELTFSIKCHPNKEESGKLDHLMKEQVDITLEPPSAEELAQMELDGYGEQEEAA